jgi:hypothetical protein
MPQKAMHLRLTHLRLTHLRLMHLRLMHLRLTHLQLMHLQLTHLRLTHLRLMLLLLTRLRHLRPTDLLAANPTAHGERLVEGANCGRPLSFCAKGGCCMHGVDGLVKWRTPGTGCS